MPSVHEIKCPSCGAENGPCLVQNGQNMYHIERKKAAYPTTYEHPDCDECRRLKDRMVSAEYAVSAFGPSSCGGKPKSKWPRAYKDEFRSQELAASEARAKYELHLGTAHVDENHQRDLGQNLTILLREGRLKPYDIRASPTYGIYNEPKIMLQSEQRIQAAHRTASSELKT